MSVWRLSNTPLCLLTPTAILTLVHLTTHDLEVYLQYLMHFVPYNYNMYATVSLFVQYVNVCVDIVCLCVHLRVHTMWYACMQTCVRVVK